MVGIEQLLATSLLALLPLASAGVERGGPQVVVRRQGHSGSPGSPEEIRSVEDYLRHFMASSDSCASAAEAARVEAIEVSESPDARERLALLRELPRHLLGRRDEGERDPVGRDIACALGILATLDLDAGLDLAVELMERAPRDTEVRRALVPPFQDAVCSRLTRGDAGEGKVPGAYRRAAPWVRARMLRALLDWESRDALRLLVSLLGIAPRCDGEILTSLARITRDSATPLEPLGLLRVRSYLRMGDPEARQRAARILAEQDDQEAIPSLVDMLREEGPGLSQAAHSALVRLTGLELPGDASRWERWYRQEREWWLTQGSDALEVLRTGAGARLTSTIQEVARHRLFRRELAGDLLDLLDHSSGTVVRLAISALASLRCPEAPRHLVPLLEARDEEHRAAALRALRAITGLDLEADVQEWTEALGEG